MKVTLINPPLNIQIRKRRISSVINNLFFNSPPLGLCYLAAVLEKEKIPVKIIDAAVENLGLPEIINRVREFDTDIVGITSTTTAFFNAVELAKNIKKDSPDVPIILGGPHVTASPQHAFSFDCFDMGVLREGEITLPMLLKALNDKGDLRGVDGIVFREDSGLFYAKPREYIKELDVLPFPARHLVPLKLYTPQPNDERALPKLSMITSRGCPYGCIFCDKNVFEKSYRSFSADYIVSEMEYLVKNFGAEDIAFVDSLFAISEKRVEDIVGQIQKRRIKVSWTCTVRANTMTKKLLKKMKDSGCWRIRLGIESGNDEVLKFIKKDIATEQVKNVANWAHEIGLQPKGFFMIGHLVDTKKTIEDSIKLAKSLPLKDITVQINTPLPNTLQYSVYKQYGFLTKQDYSNFTFWQPIFVPESLKESELIKLHRKFYRSFYLRPVIFWRHLCRIRSLRDLKKYIKVINLLLHLFFGKA